MTRETAAHGSRAKARRKDRQVEDDAWIEALLLRAPFGSMATVIDGEPFINTRMFVFDPAARAIYMHGARTGRTPEHVAPGARVCFTATEMGRLLPAETAFDMSVEYASVIAFGTASVVKDDAEKRRALALLVDKFFLPRREGIDYRAPNENEMERTAVLRVDIEEWSGKQKRAPEGFTGAFDYRALTAGPA